MLEQYAWVPAAALIIGALVRATKAGWWPEELHIPKRARPWVVFALGWLSGSLDCLITGKAFWPATVGGLISALTAMGGHDLFVNSLRKGQELGASK